MTASRRERVFTGVAAVLVLALAFWLFLGRSPSGSPTRTEVALGASVDTDAGSVTVLSLHPVEPGTTGVPAPEAGRTVEAIRFRACRVGGQGPNVELWLFSVRSSDGASAAAAGSNLTETTGDCTAGDVYAQIEGTPAAVEYAADPVAVWRLPGG